jgi:hypothetical protein
MSLTESSQRKQVVGIILVVVFLIALFVYGTKGYRAARCACTVTAQNESIAAQTCQTEDGSCPIEIKSIQ